ncbi:protein kinase [Mariniblastus sp.]|nr:protein kinase [Mariniblastus sp.]
MSQSSRRSTANPAHSNLLLRFAFGDDQVQEYYVADGLKIGRTVGNDIILNDLRIGRTHACVVLEADGSFRLRSESVENFINFNGSKANEIHLIAGTEFSIENIKFECLVGESSPTDHQLLDRTACPFCEIASIPQSLNRPTKCSNCKQEIIAVELGVEFKSLVVFPVLYGNFRAKHFVARGGMGIVLRGIEVSDDVTLGNKIVFSNEPLKKPRLRQVAIKLLLAAEGKPIEEKRFLQEIGLLERVKNPNVVGLIESGKVNNFNYLVMDWIEGRTLRDVIEGYRRGDKLATFDQVKKILKQLCAGLTAIHKAGIVHRDLKPANILIDNESNHALISDFGISTTFDSTGNEFTCLTTNGETLGTVDYMAPEQRTAPDSVDVRTDIYSLGVTVYELLTGRRVYGAYSPISKINSTVPAEFDTIINRMLSADMKDRFSNVSTLWNEIETLEDCGFSISNSGNLKLPEDTFNSEMDIKNQLVLQKRACFRVATITAGLITGCIFGIIAGWLIGGLSVTVSGFIGLVIGGVGGWLADDR